MGVCVGVLPGRSPPPNGCWLIPSHLNPIYNQHIPHILRSDFYSSPVRPTTIVVTLAPVSPLVLEEVFCLVFLFLTFCIHFQNKPPPLHCPAATHQLHGTSCPLDHPARPTFSSGGSSPIQTCLQINLLNLVLQLSPFASRNSTNWPTWTQQDKI